MTAMPHPAKLAAGKSRRRKGPIRSGDAIRLRNQETTKAISCGREWLSTSSGTSADTEWVIHYP